MADIESKLFNFFNIHLKRYQGAIKGNVVVSQRCLIFFSFDQF